jgi:hypothetical protein
MSNSPTYVAMRSRDLAPTHLSEGDTDQTDFAGRFPAGPNILAEDSRAGRGGTVVGAARGRTSDREAYPAPAGSSAKLPPQDGPGRRKERRVKPRQQDDESLLDAADAQNRVFAAERARQTMINVERRLREVFHRTYASYVSSIAALPRDVPGIFDDVLLETEDGGALM